MIPAASSENMSVGWVIEIFLSIISGFLSEVNPSGIENLIIVIFSSIDARLSKMEVAIKNIVPLAAAGNLAVN